MLLWICFCFITGPAGGQTQFDPTVAESDLRAAVIVGVLRFTEWERAPATDDQNSNLTVCAWGNPPSAQGLANASIKIRDQELRLRRPTTKEALATCPVVILGRLTDSMTTEVRSSATLNSAALVICDTCDRSRVNAAVSLVRGENRIQFEINLNRARSAGIVFSSDLLNLARHVEGL